MLAACTYGNPAAENQADKTTGRSIIRAIDQYHTDRGVFPSQLHVLAPNYLPALPKTTHNRDFVYRPFHDSDRGDDYELCFFDGPKRSSRDYGCCYMHFFDNPPHSDGWDCTGGDG
jgi:hypothetical protein